MKIRLPLLSYFQWVAPNKYGHPSLYGLVSTLSRWTLSKFYLLYWMCIGLCIVALLSSEPANASHSHNVRTENKLQVGAERADIYLPLLKNKRVGLVVNHSAQVAGQHLVDFLLSHQINVTALFAPEHGIRGELSAGEQVMPDVDRQTGVPIFSIYGKYKKPTPDMLEQIDILIFDIQDVGVRFYTYISTLHYVMESAAENNKLVLVLDRPNPNIEYIDGPVLKAEFRSFVGMHPIPILHGMTVGELAQMINGEGWLKHGVKANLTVIPLARYTRHTRYQLPIKPSPNLPNEQAIALYPSLCFFEATPVSIGRGTSFPFQMIGHNHIFIGDFTFTPKSKLGALHPKFQDQLVRGQDLRDYMSQGLDLTWLLNWAKAFTAKGEVLFTRADFMDKLAGTDQLRKQIEQGWTQAQIRESWQADLQVFKQRRQPYLLYAE